MRKPRLLDLYCCAGGGAKGYQRAGFYVVGVDNRPQPRYAGDEFVQADALEYVAEHGHEFAVIAASPPCQKFTMFQHINLARFGYVRDHPDLIAPTRRALIETGVPYVIENVQGSPLHTTIIICGHSLGLERLARHRHFESSVMLFAPRCTHRKNSGRIIGVYGERPDGHRVSHKRYPFNRTASSIGEASEIMGIDWMEWSEIKEALPPAYTEYVGRQMLAALRCGRETA